MTKSLIGAFTLLFLLLTLSAQTPVKITLINDQVDEVSRQSEIKVREELQVLLQARFVPEFETFEVTSSADFAEIINGVYQGDTDLIIGVGFEVGNYLANLENYPKPTIISFMLDNELQGLPAPVNGGSGVANLHYVQSPFNPQRDLQTLYEITPYQRLGIVTNSNVNQSTFDLRSYFEPLLAPLGVSFDLFTLETDAESLLAQMDERIDAVYMLPILDPQMREEVGNVLQRLAQRGLPTFCLLSNPAIDLGAYAAYQTDENFARIPRRVALQAMKILEGQNPEELDVAMDHYTENLIINMQAARTTRVYPGWDMMAEAVLVNVTLAETTGRELTLRSAIAEGLNSNLSIKVAEKDLGISAEDVRIARSNYLPQIDASATALALDDATVATSFGARGRYNLQAGATLTQLLVSEPAMANIAIQKLLLKSQEEVLRQSQLDIVQDITEAYLNILQTTSLVRLRNENVAVTRQNYDIAQAKEQVGFSGTSDVYRFQSELAFDNVDLNTAQAQWRQARFVLNNLLNRPIKETFQLADLTVSDSILLVTDPRLFNLITNPGDLDKFADFLVQEAFQNLPELRQLDYALAAQERSLLSQERAFYLPSIALSSEVAFPLDQYSYPESVMPIDPPTTWNAAVGVQMPIFQGNSRRYQQQQTKVGVLQLKDQLANLGNNLELQVRANMETAGASFSNLQLSQVAVEASRKNFEIAQNSYQQGLLNITSLIDAQNALLQAEINAINAEYTFINDFLAVERAIGYFHFLALPQDQDAFFQRFAQYILNEE